MFFEITQATETPWMAGIPGGGTGIDYHISLQIKTKEKIQFDSIWVGGQRLEAFMNPQKENLVEIKATLMNPREDYFPELVSPPITHQGAALLRYASGKKIYWISIKNFIKLNPVALP